MKRMTSGWVILSLGMVLAGCEPGVISTQGGRGGEAPHDDVWMDAGDEQDIGGDALQDLGLEEDGEEDAGEQGGDVEEVGEADSGNEEVPRAEVSFLSPVHGAQVENPVRFSIAAAHVAKVQIEADGWPLSPEPWDPSTKTTLEYTFSGTGYAREIVLFGLDAQGVEVARATISITVKAPEVVEPPPGKGTSLGAFINTYYYVEEESAHGGAATERLYDRSCSVLATVPESFARLACIEGTAKLKDGRVINYATNTQCGGPCKFTWAVMDPTRFPWGMGNRSNALVPLRSWAVDTGVIANGTVLYVEEWDGKVIPQIGTLGGMTHDGCFRADDVGGGIQGKHVDIFAGSRAMYQELNRTFPTRTSFVVYKDSPRCAHLQ